MKRERDTDGLNRGSKAAHPSKYGKLSAAGASQEPDWARINMDLIAATIAAVTKDDGGIMFGYTRDGGAYTVKVYDGAQVDKFYAHSDDEITNILNGIWEVNRG